MYGQLKEPPLSNMSRIRVSIGVFPTNRTKNNCSMTCALTVLSDGSRRRSLPNLVGWFGYWLLTYSSRAHCDFSCILSIWLESDRPHASETEWPTLVYYFVCILSYAYIMIIESMISMIYLITSSFFIFVFFHNFFLIYHFIFKYHARIVII